MKFTEFLGMIALTVIWIVSFVPAVKNFLKIYKNESVPPIGKVRRIAILIFFSIGLIGMLLCTFLFIYKIKMAILPS